MPGSHRFRHSGRLIVAASLVLTTCSSSSGPDSSERPPAPDYSSATAVCELLSPDDLAAALGRTFDQGSGPELSAAFIGLPGVTKCQYLSSDPETPGGGVVTGVVYAYARLVFEKAKGLRKDYASEPLPGVGEDALWYPQAGEIVVLDDEKVFGIAMAREQTEPPSYLRERGRRIALKALERLR